MSDRTAYPSVTLTIGVKFRYELSGAAPYVSEAASGAAR